MSREVLALPQNDISGNVRCFIYRSFLVLFLVSILASRTVLAEVTPEEAETAQFYGTLLSTLGGHIDRLEFTLTGDAHSNRSDRNNMIRVITVNRHDLVVSLEDMHITAGEPVSAASLGEGAQETLLIPLEIDIGRVAYHNPKLGTTQFWRKPSSDADLLLATPAPAPQPTPRAEAEERPMQFRIARLTIHKFHMINGTYEYHRILHDDKEGELKEDLVVEAMDCQISNLKYDRYSATAELAPATFTARLRSASARPAEITATGFIVPEYETISFDATGQVSNLSLNDLQPLIPYSAGIYIDSGTADVSVIADCNANHLKMDHVARIYNARTSSPNTLFNPFMYIARSQLEDIRQQTLRYTVVHEIGDRETSFGKSYGKGIGGALSKELGGRLAAALTYKAPLTIVNTVFKILTLPFTGFGAAPKPQKAPKATPTPAE